MERTGETIPTDIQARVSDRFQDICRRSGLPEFYQESIRYILISSYEYARENESMQIIPVSN